MLRLTLLLVIIITANICFAVEKGGIKYTPKIDYSLINTKEFENKGFQYYTNAANAKSEEKRLQNAESAIKYYRALMSKYPDNPDYALKLGLLYELTGKNKYAKEFYYRATTINENYAPAYEAFGNYYYTRKEYRRALKQYNEAYIINPSVYNVCNKIGTIYQKLGDTRSALKYFKEGYKINPSEELNTKIRLLEELNSSNTLYYKNTRIHFVED